jgi:hypothetical protein
MLFLRETAEPAPAGGAPAERKTAAGAGNDAGDGSYPAAVNRWMDQHGVSAEAMDKVFHFKDDGSFETHDVPGKSMREKTLNTYILTGVGNFLASNNRTFDDSLARGFCEKMGCYDKANHAAHLKKHRGAEFSGDKSKGYTVTNVGIKRGAALVKELAGAAE